MSTDEEIVSIGNYLLDHTSLGKGTFAKVELATHTLLDRKVALKIIIKSKIKDPYMAKNLTREASLLCRLNHPNIVKLLEVCRATDLYCLVLEFVPGGTLFEHIQSRGALQEDESRGLCRQLISAIAYLHGERILHRDLKLENIMLNRGHLVLIDFGLSNNWYPGKMMNTHCGSAEYASPELFNKDITYGSSVDVWSFGIILYTMSLGHLPFQVRNDGAGGEDTLPRLIKSIMKGLVKKHHVEMNKLTIDCRVLIMRCLDVNAKTRISVKAISVDPWLGHPGTWTLRPLEKQISDLEIAKELKTKLNVMLPPDQIVNHVKGRRYGTTGGCFNLLKLDRLNVDPFTKPLGTASILTLNRSVHPSNTRVKHLSAHSNNSQERKGSDERSFKCCKIDPKPNTERRSRSQDSNGHPSWKRSFLNTPPSGKVRIARLKRVDSNGTSEKDTHDSGIIKFGHKALEDITNSVRPLLRRNSKKGSKPDVIPSSKCEAIKDSKVPFSLKDSLLPQRDKKMKLHEQKVYKKPLR